MKKRPAKAAAASAQAEQYAEQYRKHLAAAEAVRDARVRQSEKQLKAWQTAVKPTMEAVVALYKAVGASVRVTACHDVESLGKPMLKGYLDVEVAYPDNRFDRSRFNLLPETGSNTFDGGITQAFYGSAARFHFDHFDHFAATVIHRHVEAAVTAVARPRTLFEKLQIEWKEPGN